MCILWLAAICAALGIGCLLTPWHIGMTGVCLLLLAAVLLGFYGLMAALALLILHLGCLESFGAPYTAPFTDRLGPGGLTGLIKRPNRADKFRSPHLAGRNKRRQK